MARSNNLTRRTVPPQALVAIAVLAIIILGYFGWRAIAGYDSVGGARKKVYPGMYDLRAEVAKRSASRAAGDRQHGP